jgi:solute carrier family 25 phosphate transporter 3
MALFPNSDALHNTFGSPYSRVRSQGKPSAGGATPYQARPELYPAYSVIDDAKNKAQKLSAEATKEFEAASQKAQSKAGHIELFSGKYYAACTIGGMMACVSAAGNEISTGYLPSPGPDPRSRHSP